MYNTKTIANNTVPYIRRRVDHKIFDNKEKFYNYVRWYVLTKLVVVIISQYRHISNHYVAHLKLTQCQYTSQ